MHKVGGEHICLGFIEQRQICSRLTHSGNTFCKTLFSGINIIVTSTCTTSSTDDESVHFIFHHHNKKLLQNSQQKHNSNCTQTNHFVTVRPCWNLSVGEDRWSCEWR